MILLILISSKCSSYLILICLCVVFNGASKVIVDLKSLKIEENIKKQCLMLMLNVII